MEDQYNRIINKKYFKKYLKYKKKYFNLKQNAGTNFLQSSNDYIYQIDSDKVWHFIQSLSLNLVDEDYKPEQIINYHKFFANKLGKIRSISNKDHLQFYNEKPFKIVTKEQIKEVTDDAINIYNRIIPNFINLREELHYVMKLTVNENSEISFFGDYHSGIYSLVECLLDLRNKDFFEDDTWILREDKYIVFTGDLVDRGPYSTECLYLVYCLFVINNQNTERVIILNGNHEEKNYYSSKYGDFGFELETQIQDETIKNDFETLIDKLPLALFVKYDNFNYWYQFCHGSASGIHINNFVFYTFLNNEDNTDKIFLFPQKGQTYELIYDKTFILPLTSGDGFMWSDMTNEKISELDFDNPIIRENIYNSAVKGRPIFFKDQLQEILSELNIKMVISGHQDQVNLGLIVKDGVENDNYVDNLYYYNKSILEKGTKLKTHQMLTSSNIDNQVTKEIELPVEELIGLTLSSATISKGLNFSIYGILKNPTIKLYAFDSCSTISYYNKGVTDRVELCNNIRNLV